jgi:hypothetical protein
MFAKSIIERCTVFASKLPVCTFVFWIAIFEAAVAFSDPYLEFSPAAVTVSYKNGY